MHSPDIIEPAIIRLSNDSVDGLGALVPFLPKSILHYCFHCGTDTERIGQHYRRLEIAQLLYLC